MPLLHGFKGTTPSVKGTDGNNKWKKVDERFGLTDALAKQHTARLRLMHKTAIKPMCMDKIQGHYTFWKNLAPTKTAKTTTTSVLHNMGGNR